MFYLLCFGLIKPMCWSYSSKEIRKFLNSSIDIKFKIKICTHKYCPDKGILERPCNFIELYDDWEEKIQCTTDECKLHIEDRSKENRCTMIDPTLPMNITVFNGGNICGKRGKTNFYGMEKEHKRNLQQQNQIVNNTNSTEIIKSQSSKDLKVQNKTNENNTEQLIKGSKVENNEIIQLNKVLNEEYNNSEKPIRDIRIISSNVKEIPEGYKKLQLSESWTIIFSNDTSKSTKLPIIDFKLSESLPCVHPNETSFTPGRRMYPLFTQKSSKGCISSFNKAMIFDTRYLYAGKTSEAQLFKDNSLDKLVESLPLHKEYFNSKEYDYTLYAKTYVPWNKENPECSNNNEVEITTMTEQYDKTIIPYSTFLICLIKLENLCSSKISLNKKFMSKNYELKLTVN